MLAMSRYAVTVPGPPGGHAPPELIVVHLTAEVGVDGEPVYADSSGRYRFHISGQVARLIPGAAKGAKGRMCHRCLQAQPLG
jgi:hypothetical protein